MTVITISRQMGSLGSEIASLAAVQLGYRLVWRELINQAARRSGTPEAALAVIDELNLLGITPSRQDSAAYKLAVEQIMLELLAEDRVVILGRAGQVILHNRTNVLHIRVIAPMDQRIARIAERRGVDLQSARAQVEASDHNRASYMRRFYKVRWEDPALYHLTINTGLLPAESAVQIIARAVTQPLSIQETQPGTLKA
jgi:CMP/dCMP kinase